MTKDDDITKFATSVACDASGFARSLCPRCDLEFKIEGESRAFNDVLTWETKRIEVSQTDEDETSDADHPQDDSSDTTCPYCGHQDSSQEFLHPEMREFLIRVVRRELVEPMLINFSRNINRMFKGNSLLSVKVSGASFRSQRPFSGPEPNDQLVVRCLNC